MQAHRGTIPHGALFCVTSSLSVHSAHGWSGMGMQTHISVGYHSQPLMTPAYLHVWPIENERGKQVVIKHKLAIKEATKLTEARGG